MDANQITRIVSILTTFYRLWAQATRCDPSSFVFCFRAKFFKQIKLVAVTKWFLKQNMDFGKMSLTRLNNRNYRSWAFKVKMTLMREGTWGFVEPGVAPSPITDVWIEGDAKARATIALLVEDNQHSLIYNKTTAKTTWDTLKAHHQKATLTGKVALLKEICSANYKEGENMEEFLYSMEELYSRLENAGERLSQYMQVAMVLRSLPKAFDALTTALENRSDDDLTMELVRSKLIDESDKLYSGGAAEERALKAANANNTEAIVCFFCGKPGHKKRTCKLFLRQKSSDKKKGSERLKTVRENDQVSFLFSVRSRVPVITRAWLIDSGASSHLANDEQLFTRLDKSVRREISTADGKPLRTEGIGDCVIQCVDDLGKNTSVTITDVIFAPDIECNLLSVGKLSSKGVCVQFNKSNCKLLYGAKVVAVADKVGGLYRLNMADQRAMLVKGSRHTKECQHSWHRRLGHRDPVALKELERKNLASGIRIRDCGIRTTCECCVKAKMSRPPFPKQSEKKSKEVLATVCRYNNNLMTT